MSVYLTADVGIPFPTSRDALARDGYLERARAAVQTIRELMASGATVPEVTEEDRVRSREVAVTGVFTDDVTEEDAPMLLHLDALLTRYDFELLNASARLNNYVINRLLAETDNDDPKIRLRALELLGKTSRANSFSDTLNVNVTHRTVQEIDAELESMARRLVGTDEVQDAVFTPVADDG